MKRQILALLLCSTTLPAADAIRFEEWIKTLQIDPTPIENAAQTPMSYAPVVKAITPSVVSIFTTKALRIHRRQYQGPIPEDILRQFFDPNPNDPRLAPQGPEQRGLGSGIIVTADGYILTNNHVVADADEIRVYVSSLRKDYMAKIIGTDPKTDVALIKIDATDLPHATLTKSSNVQVGDVALAIGSPFELESSVTQGIISAIGRTNVGAIQGGYENFLQTDASINPGNSGGALVDAKGRVIGINTAIASTTGANNGIGFAIPIDMALGIVHQLINTGSVHRGFLGVIPDDVDAALARYNNLPSQRGAIITHVDRNSPAESAGLEPGDIITHMNTKVIDDARTLRFLVADQEPGAKVVFTLVREGQAKEVTVILETLQDGDPARRPAHNAPIQEGEIIPGLQVIPSPEGLVVSAVAPNSAPAGAGLKPGMIILDINRQNVSNLAEAHAAANNNATDRDLLRIKEGDTIRYVVVE